MLWKLYQICNWNLIFQPNIYVKTTHKICTSFFCFGYMWLLNKMFVTQIL